MTRKKGKPVSFDAMVKFFMKHNDIPTKKDIDRLAEKIDRLEKLLTSSGFPGTAKKATGRAASHRKAKTATYDYESVLQIIKRSRKGVDFAAIKEKTGFNEKKIRNIIFRLHKMKQIKRKGRGIYISK